MSQIEVNGASFYYEIRGAGPPLVLIAGFTRDHTLWAPMLSRLSAHFQVMVFDNRGVGRTKDDGRELSAELLAEDVKALMQALHLQKPYLVGQSMGGCIAQRVASTYPEEISGLGLLVTSAKWRAAALYALKGQLTLRQHGVPLELLFESTFPWVFGERFLDSPANIEMARKAFLSNPYPQSIEDHARQFAILERFDGRADLQNIKAPTLILYGKEDLLAPPSDAAFLSEHIPHAHIEGFDGGHGLIVEAAEGLCQSLCRCFITNPIP